MRCGSFAQIRRGGDLHEMKSMSFDGRRMVEGHDGNDSVKNTVS